MLGRHDGAEGAVYRRAWHAVTGEYGQPARNSLLALEMGRVALAYANLIAATEALSAARRMRATGKGRRPAPRAIERLSRRCGLADRTYAEARGKLEEMLATRRPVADPLTAMLTTMGQRNGAPSPGPVHAAARPAEATEG
jgi:hypothetical protein